MAAAYVVARLPNRGLGMLRSMTGFGKFACADERLMLTVELKSVNSKILDLGALRVPTRYRMYEGVLRNLLAEGLERGKVEMQVTLTWQEGYEPVLSGLNKTQFAHLVSTLREACQVSHLQCSDDAVFQVAMQTEGIWHQEELPVSEAELELLKGAVLGAIAEVNTFREKEAEATARDFLQQIETIRAKATQIDKIKDLRPEFFRARFDEALAKLKARENIEIDDSRLAQEIFYHIQRLDVNEELKRLEQHCAYFEQTLKASVSQGRKLSFIAQEMGREINTLGSKSCDKEMQHLVVEMKDALEKIKEQVLNIL